MTRSFLKSSWTTAGYDPSFMAGYAKSVVFPSSSTLPELAIAAFGGDHPEYAYKIYVLISAAAVPCLIALACVMWRIPVAGASVAVLLDLLYIWTDFPINYVTFGMLPYFLAVPVGLAATGAFARFLARGGPIHWLVTAVLMSMAFLFHLTVAMVIVLPAAAGGLRCRKPAPRRSDQDDNRLDRRRERVFVSPVDEPERKLAFASHLAVWALPIVVLAVNAFWWLPGIWLASTKGASDFAFAHPEGVTAQALADPRFGSANSGRALGGGPAGTGPDLPPRSGPRIGPDHVLRRRHFLGLSGRRPARSRLLAAWQTHVRLLYSAGGRRRRGL